MKVIVPTPITDAMLTSSIAEPSTGEVAWVSGAAYTVGTRRIRSGTHRIYECVAAVGSGVTTLPEADAAHWLDVGPTNRWAMLDGVVNTQSQAASSITVIFTPGIVDSLSLLELVGGSVTITQKDAPGGTVVYTQTMVLEGSVVLDWYQYYFESFQPLDTAVFQKMGPYANNEITATITGIGTVKCGVISVGKAYEIGDTLASPTIGILDYSSKTTDRFGVTKLTKRAFSKRMDARLLMEARAFTQLYRLLASLRSTPTVWLGSDLPGLSPLVVYGFYQDFSIEIAYPDFHLCSLQVQGLI